MSMSGHYSYNPVFSASDSVPLRGFDVSPAEPSPAFSQMSAAHSPYMSNPPDTKRFPSPSPAPSPQPPEYSSSPPPKHKKHKPHYWSVELLCLFASAAAIAASVYVLHRFNGQPIPPWSWRSNGLSINSLLSLLSTFSRSSLLIPLDECIGQLMWLAFAERETRLSMAEVYNEASRGPWGAAKLIYRRKGWGTACIGSFVMIMAVGLGTAQQQLLSYPSINRVVPSKSSVTVGASPGTFDSWQDQESRGQVAPMVDFSVSASALAAINTGQIVTPPYQCPSTNCTYGAFSTLSICSDCETVNNEIDIDCSSNYCTASYGDLTAYSWKGDPPSGSYQTVLNQTAKHSETAIADVKSLWATLKKWPPEYRASNCRLMWCIQTINASIVNSVYQERVLTTETTAKLDSDGTAILANKDNKEFRVSKQAQEAFQNFAQTLSGTTKCTGKKHGEGNQWLHTSPTFAGLAKFASSNNSTEQPMVLMAKGMTAAVRSKLDIKGQIIERTTIIRVRWWWLLYPVAMWALSAVFLFMTMIKSRRRSRTVGFWGSSNIALLLWGPRDRETVAMLASGRASDMNRKSEAVKARLVQEGDGWRLEARRG